MKTFPLGVCWHHQKSGWGRYQQKGTLSEYLYMTQRHQTRGIGRGWGEESRTCKGHRTNKIARRGYRNICNVRAGNSGLPLRERSTFVGTAATVLKCCIPQSQGVDSKKDRESINSTSSPSTTQKREQTLRLWNTVNRVSQPKIQLNINCITIKNLYLGSLLTAFASVPAKALPIMALQRAIQKIKQTWSIAEYN